MKLFLMTGWTQEIPWIFIKHLFSELCKTNKVPGVEASTSRESVKLWFTWFFHFFVDPQKLWTWICQNFMDPQNLVNPDDKKMWIHKNLNWTMPKKCGSTKFCEHLWQKNVDPQKIELDYAKKMWIHKILFTHMSSFCESTKTRIDDSVFFEDQNDSS